MRLRPHPGANKKWKPKGFAYVQPTFPFTHIKKRVWLHFRTICLKIICMEWSSCSSPITALFYEDVVHTFTVVFVLLFLITCSGCVRVRLQKNGWNVTFQQLIQYYYSNALRHCMHIYIFIWNFHHLLCVWVGRFCDARRRCGGVSVSFKRGSLAQWDLDSCKLCCCCVWTFLRTWKTTTLRQQLYTIAHCSLVYMIINGAPTTTLLQWLGDRSIFYAKAKEWARDGKTWHTRCTHTLLNPLRIVLAQSERQAWFFVWSGRPVSRLHHDFVLLMHWFIFRCCCCYCERYWRRWKINIAPFNQNPFFNW